MNLRNLLFTLSICLFVWACGGTTKTETEKVEEKPKAEEPVKEEPKVDEALVKGEQIFQTKCMACHMMSKDALIGPGMIGVTKRVPSKEWAKKFIKNSQEVIKSGDKYAVELFEKFKKVPMTPFDLSDEEFESVWKYLEENSK